MIVYVVFDEGDLVAVCATEKKAEVYANRYEDQYSRDGFTCEMSIMPVRVEE